MAQRKRRPSRSGHRRSGAAAGLSGPSPMRVVRLHSVDTHPPTREGLPVGPPAGAAPEFDIRTADRAADAAGGHHADLWEGRRGPRRPGRPR